jgi:hypothetical protein
MTIRPVPMNAPPIPHNQFGALVNPYDPKSGYVPLADVAFAPVENVMPHELPPQTVPYPASWFTYLAGTPAISTIYENRRKYVVKF